MSLRRTTVSESPATFTVPSAAESAADIPPRYARSLGLLGAAGHHRLRAAHAAIVGAGGLGGVVFEILARYGVGRITIVDHDDFEASNLNRQLLSTMRGLGTNKAIAAAERALSINPEIAITACAQRLTDENACRLLSGTHIACDCLGNIRDRFVLERAAKQVNIPLVHASIAGTEGRLMTIFPGDAGFSAIYGEEREAPASGEETEKGTPPSTVWAIAAMQAHEAVAVLAGIGPPLRNTLLTIDLTSWRMQALTISQG